MFFNLWTTVLDASLLFSHSGSSYFAPACCNWSFINVPDLDKALDAWVNAPDTASLEAASKQAQRVAAEQAAWISLVTPKNVWVHSQKVHGWVPLQSNLYPFYNDVWLG
jgi:ABC-type transport system substrate-binding protein